MPTAPFDPEVEQLVTQTHYQDFTAVAVVAAVTYPLEVTAYSVDWDGDRTPRVSARLDCVVPDEAVLAALDPRTSVRVKVTVAYRLPSGVLDSHQVADLHLRDRTVNRPGNTMTLTCASDDMLLVDAAPSAAFYEGFLLHDSAVGFIDQTIDQLVLGTPAAPATFVSTMPTDGGEFVAEAFPSDWWNVMVDAADAMDADLYDNGDRVFRLAPRRYLTSDSSAVLSVGANGSITESQSGVDRDRWYNAATLLWVWSNRANPLLPDRTWGIAYVDSGPFAAASSGRREFVQRRDGQVSAITAQRAAVTVLRRLLAKARTYRIDAVAMWWLRPSDTVTIQLPTGTQERHLVASVVFNTGGKMTVVTRLPDDTSVIGE
jgi:hypothetical protein